MRNKLLLILLLSSSLLLTSSLARAETDIGFVQAPNTQLSGEVQVVDEHGVTRRLKDYFGAQPTLLTFVYFGCPNLCTLVLNGLAEGLKESALIPGQDVHLLSISIDPKEKPALALAKKRSYLARIGLTGDDHPAWGFLTASQSNIETLTKEAGFHFRYDASTGEFNHPSGLIVLTPEGKISRYLFGIRFSAQDLKSAVEDAAQGKSHRSLKEIILNCFHYQPENGRYGHLIVLILQIVSGFTILCLGILFYRLGRNRAVYE